MRNIFIVLILTIGVSTPLAAQKSYKFISTQQQIRNLNGFYNVVDTVMTNDTVTIELNARKNLLTLTYSDNTKNVSYKTNGCGKIKDQSFACTIPDQSWGSLIQIKDDSEILFVLTDKIEMKFRSLTPVDTKRK